MSTRGVVIRFEGPEAWEEHNENVSNILEKATGESTYPSTRSLPPIIFGLQLRAETIAELTALGGVFVDIVGEE
ncbi:hypothetical protein E8E15_004260 [Penicillium rubens]|uniref:Inhibitor I9 domain-containing protein n=1 Tax=Penicillium chrysogenum TaxID=5076 RepID=A0A167TQM0_PENCH|nr:hypothetical protein E8E15_004260 [Penicillium rubens]KZN88516.1 hypothetical protein EN45_070910 [Penicillium chrysogenum]